MSSTGTKTANQMYQASGWCAHHNTDIWGDTAPQDIYAQGAYWPMGGAWLLSHVYEHYRFTGDIQFLKKYYNIMYSAVQFYQDFLVDYNGWKVTNPSVSPENSYKNGTISGSMTIGSTIDSSILWELFGNLLEAAQILGKPVLHDQTLMAAQTLRAQLPPLRVSPTTGTLMEWIADFTEVCVYSSTSFPGFSRLTRPILDTATCHLYTASFQATRSHPRIRQYGMLHLH